ncbi:Methylated-DNA--protein-cysteine methyltransferase, constitutive [Patescibacteria group bacterium]|nr:Methylated-DNA--protein-cysteine methyltransferase, constitutive [Patescibacteria group bacterium]
MNTGILGQFLIILYIFECIMPIYFQQTAMGHIGIAEQNGLITDVYFEGETIANELIIENTRVLNEAFLQLNAYLAGELTVFSLPLAPKGTAFMQTVWQALLTIPYGSTVSYKAIAIAIDKPKAMRAVGMANAKNPIPIFIPCHRVIGSHGQLVGYSGGLAIKEFLLNLEQSIKL